MKGLTLFGYAVVVALSLVLGAALVFSYARFLV